MEAATLMTQQPVTVDEEMPIDMAWKLMKQLDVRHLPVVDNGKLVGIVSDRQLLTRANRALDGHLEFPDLCIAEVMTFHPASCSPRTPARHIAAEMLHRQIDAMPVVEDEHLVGLITMTDLVALLARD